MKQHDSTIAKPTRGRPRSLGKVSVVQRLLDAAEMLLQNENHVNLTERNIAAAARVDIRMIHYYFHDKEGLIFAVIARYCDSVSDNLAKLDAIDLESKTVTRDIYKILVDAFYAKPWIARILASELAHGHSQITELFTRKYGSQGEAPLGIRRAFERLIERGVYDSRLDITRSVLALFLMSLAPVMVGPLFGYVGAETDWFKNSDWLDYVADLFDRKLRGST